MRPQDSKDGHSPSRPSRTPPSSRGEPEEMTEESSEESGQSNGEEEVEDGRESYAPSAPGPSSTHHRINSSGITLPSNTTTAAAPMFQYRRPVSPSRTPLQTSAPLAPAQPSTRPQDPQTPPRGTTRGLEGDLLHAGEILWVQTTLSYHRRLADARSDHTEHANEETSSALARAVASDGAIGGRPQYYSRFPPVTPVLRRSAAQQLGTTVPNPFGRTINSLLQLPQPTQGMESDLNPGDFGSSMAAMAPFHRQAAQSAFEQLTRRQQVTPPPYLPRRPQRPTVPHPAHFQSSTQSSASQQPVQQSPRPPTRPSSRPQDPDRPTGGPSR